MTEKDISTKIAEDMTERIKTSFSSLPIPLVVYVDSIDIGSASITIQPLSSNTSYEARDIVREDYAFQVSYNLPTNSDPNEAISFFTAFERAFNNGTYTSEDFSYRIVNMVRNAPVTINKLSETEGLIDSNQLNDFIVRSTALVYCSRWLSIEEEEDTNG